VRQLRHVLRSACALADGEAIRLEHLPVTLQTATLPALAASAGSTVAISATASASATAAAPTPGTNAQMAGAGADAASNLPASDDELDGSGEEADEAVLKLNPILANERRMLLKMLEQHRWNVSSVAKAFDVSRNTLYRRLHKLRIRLSHPSGE
jgi:transcriptional regulator of acetoin/glycerol metabolism